MATRRSDIVTGRQRCSDSQRSVSDSRVPASVLPRGDYDLRVKENQSLARVVRNVIVTSPGDAKQIVSITVAQFRPGDINGDNVVHTADVQSLKNGFGHLSGETEFKDKSDFNQAGIIDVEDFPRMSRILALSGHSSLWPRIRGGIRYQSLTPRAGAFTIPPGTKRP